MSRGALRRVVLRRRGTGWVIAVSLATTACQGAVPAPAAQALPTWCVVGNCVGVPAVPRRTAILRAVGACLTLEVDGSLALALWPKGSTVGTGPIIVVGPDGREVARVGVPVELVLLGPERTGTPQCGMASTINVYVAAPPQ